MVPLMNPTIYISRNNSTLDSSCQTVQSTSLCSKIQRCVSSVLDSLADMYGKVGIFYFLFPCGMYVTLLVVTNSVLIALPILLLGVGLGAYLHSRHAEREFKSKIASCGEVLNEYRKLSLQFLIINKIIVESKIEDWQVNLKSVMEKLQEMKNEFDPIFQNLKEKFEDDVAFWEYSNVKVFDGVLDSLSTRLTMFSDEEFDERKKWVQDHLKETQDKLEKIVNGLPKIVEAATKSYASNLNTINVISDSMRGIRF